MPPLGTQAVSAHLEAMPLILAFLMGVANFAMHRAVLESRHPMLTQMPLMFRSGGGRVGYALEFAVLLGSMLMVAHGSAGWAIAYGCYTGVNALSAWAILTGRI